MIYLSKIDNNLVRIDLGNLTIYFSYSTPVAFYDGQLHISKNIWSVTTGKHLNKIYPDKAIRLDNDIFTKLLQKAIKPFND